VAIVNSKHAILVVDDERSVRDSLERVLAREGFRTFQAQGAAQAEQILEMEEIAVVLTDLKMPEVSGLELLKRIKKKYPQIEVLLITGHGTIEKAVQAMKEGAYDFITKPFKRAEILRSIDKALEKRYLEQENRLLKEQLAMTRGTKTKLIGESKAMREILQLVDRVAPLPSTVLITGESGTGKEIVARMIHMGSPRRDKSFVAVNCGAISENLIESELFGHVKGAFTGAFRDKDGLFKIASGGTLFLDEISTIPLNLQVKLLRAIEEHEIMPVGSTRTIPVDARIIAASNRDLGKDVELGTFREDLFYRLNVIGITIPPLRERRDDIPLLVDYFIKKFNRELNKSVTGVSEIVLKQFISYNWKGNVRELENAIERAIILCDGDTIMPEHLPNNFALGAFSSKNARQGLRDSVMEFERVQIAKTMEVVKWDKKAAARLLGLSISSLYRKMTELGMDVKQLKSPKSTKKRRSEKL